MSIPEKFRFEPSPGFADRVLDVARATQASVLPAQMIGRSVRANLPLEFASIGDDPTRLVAVGPQAVYFARRHMDGDRVYTGDEVAWAASLHNRRVAYRGTLS